METYVKIMIISLFSVFNHDFVIQATLILHMSLLQTQQLMTSQMGSLIEYLMQTYNILVLILYSKSTRNVAALTVFNTID